MRSCDRVPHLQSRTLIHSAVRRITRCVLYFFYICYKNPQKHIQLLLKSRAIVWSWRIRKINKKQMQPYKLPQEKWSFTLKKLNIILTNRNRNRNRNGKIEKINNILLKFNQPTARSFARLYISIQRNIFPWLIKPIHSASIMSSMRVFLLLSIPLLVLFRQYSIHIRLNLCLRFGSVHFSYFDFYLSSHFNCSSLALSLTSQCWCQCSRTLARVFST